MYKSYYIAVRGQAVEIYQIGRYSPGGLANVVDGLWCWISKDDFGGPFIIAQEAEDDARGEGQHEVAE